MDCLQLDKFCCCLGLKAGGITVGLLGIFYGIVGISSNFETSFFSFGLPWNIPLSVIMIIIFAIYLYGIFSERAWFMLPGIIFHVLSVALTTCLLVAFIIFSSRDKSKARAVIQILISLVILPITWYFVVVSISLFKKIKNQNNITNQGIVYGTAEERSDLNQVEGQMANSPPDTKFSR